MGFRDVNSFSVTNIGDAVIATPELPNDTNDNLNAIFISGLQNTEACGGSLPQDRGGPGHAKTSSINAGTAATDLTIRPNPFKELIHIQLALEEKSTVSLSLYDIMGKEIQHIPIHHPLSEGTHHFEVPTIDLPSGVYYCQLHTQSLETKERVESQSIKLLKIW